MEERYKEIEKIKKQQKTIIIMLAIILGFLSLIVFDTGENIGTSLSNVNELQTSNIDSQYDNAEETDSVNTRSNTSNSSHGESDIIITLNPTAASTPTAYIINSDPQEQIVYITDTGSKYHRGTCGYLKDSKHAITLAEAIARGYEPCKVCKP